MTRAGIERIPVIHIICYKQQPSSVVSHSEVEYTVTIRPVIIITLIILQVDMAICKLGKTIGRLYHTYVFYKNKRILKELLKVFQMYKAHNRD